MTINRKANEALLNQVEWFFEYAEKNWTITKKQEREISKILWLNESEKKWLIERLSKKFWKDIDISDVWEIKKVFIKKHIDFNKIWVEYTRYLKVIHLFEDCKTPFDDVNDKIINLIMNNYSEDVLEKVRIFISSKIYKESYMEWKIKSEDFLRYYIEYVEDKDDLKFLLNNLSLDDLADRIQKHDYLHSWFDIHIFKDNISLLNKYWFNHKNLTLEKKLDWNLQKYVKLIVDSDVEWFRNNFNQEEENDELKNIFLKFKDLTKDELLECCIKCWIYEIDKIFNKRPDIHYENNAWYTSKLVHMFWWDWDNNKLMHKYFWWWDFDILAYLWTIYWTKNWKNNIDLAYEKGFIKDKKIASYENRYLSDNDYIAHLKMIDNEILDLLIWRWVNEEDFYKFLWVTYSMNYEILETLSGRYSNITIKELNLLSGVLHLRESTNLYFIFNKYPDIKINELALLENENTHILSYAKIENLNKIFEKYPNIQINDLVLLENVLQNNEMLFLEFLNFGTKNPSSKSLNILNLFNNYTKKHGEIFQNIENKDEINDDNWIDITCLYSANEYFEDDKTIPEEIKIRIRELLQSDESKDFIYRKLSKLLKISLSDNEDLTNEEIALLAVLNKKWLWSMWQSESLAKFIYQINKLDKNYKYSKAFSEIKWDIKKFIYSHKNDSNELINSFYQISTSLFERSPAIYRNVIKLLNKLDSKEQEIFYKEIFPLYNVELFLWENPWQYKLLWKMVNNNVEWQLIPMHDRIKMLMNKLTTDKQIDVNSLLLEEKNLLVENIKQLFKEKFWIKKIPTEFSKENIESIRWHSIYLSNMNNRDEEKSTVLWYFLALKLNWKRAEFRAWKDFDPSEYMDDSKVYIIKEYLSKRSKRISINKLQDIEEWDRVILQENESNTIIWNTNWITDRLHTIESNIKTLLDNDIYSERQKIIKKYVSKDLGKLLAKQFQILSGKSIPLSDEEKQILSEISSELWDDLNDIINVQNLQNECKPISAIINFINKILNENLPKEIQDFENLCKPSAEHLELLRKIWINLEDNLIISSNSYLSYVESWIKKWKDKLTAEEYDSLNWYIVMVHKELDDLYGIKDKLTTLYEDFKNKIIDKYFDNTELK